MKLSPQQEDALEIVEKRLSIGEPVTRVFGYAGTGKTTIAKTLARSGGGNVLFAAYTGKAASVLTRKGCPASTIHSLIYLPRGDAGAIIEKYKLLLESDPGNEAYQEHLAEARKMAGKPGFVLREPEMSPLKDADLLVLDEVSMVDEKMAKDLLSFDVPILALGDPAQLPPVGGEGFFTAGGEKSADAMLTQIHRQALDSPVLALATEARTAGWKRIPYMDGMVVPEIGRKAAAGFDQVLVGTNKTRWQKNLTLRKLRFGKLPTEDLVQGEKIIVLQNDQDRRVLNGQQFYVLQVEPTKQENIMNVVLDCDCRPMGESQTVQCDICGWVSSPVPMWRYGFQGMEGEKELKEMSYQRSRRAVHATYGYAITVHKAQGSEWDRVLVIDESFCFRSNARKWLYTAITRAASEVVVVR